MSDHKTDAMALVEQLEKASHASQEANLRVTEANFKLIKARIGMAKDTQETSQILASIAVIKHASMCW